jgi:SHS2 domain-containing protein
MWEHFSHSADIGVRGIADTLEDAFAQAAYALTAVVCDPKTIEPREAIEIRCESIDSELLLADWLNTVIYEMDVRKMLFSRFDVSIKDFRLTAKVWGEKIDPKRHKITVGVKAATYMELNVARNEKGLWVAQCVVDV